MRIPASHESPPTTHSARHSPPPPPSYGSKTPHLALPLLPPLPILSVPEDRVVHIIPVPILVDLLDLRLPPDSVGRLRFTMPGGIRSGHVRTGIWRSL